VRNIANVVTGHGGVDVVFMTMAAALVVVAAGCARRTPGAGFWYSDKALALPEHATERLGGPLTDDERASIETISRNEVERAFQGLNIRVSDNPSAFWRVDVVESLPRRGPLPNAGESMSLGWMGGAGAVSFELVALKAVQYAPDGASRGAIVEAIGRGIGHVAVHEFAHQILNTSAVHNKDDERSYEYPSPDRSAQYYGDLHWTTARPLLEQTLR
jgi:hypothetical protein